MRDFLRQILTARWAKPIVFLGGLVPLGFLAVRAYNGQLGANPVEFLQHFTGDWTLRFLLITLAVTPLRKILNFPDLIRFRRMLGLFAFTYVCLHFFTYIGPDQSFDLVAMWKDVAKRPFITVGFFGFVLLIPLAITSTKGWIRRLGGKNWRALHRLIYVTALCSVVHYYWLVKSDHRRPLLYAVILALLLLYRLVTSLIKSRSAPVTVQSQG